MSSPALEAIRRGHRVAWEGPCEISGVGASAAVPHWLVVTEAGLLAFVHGPEGGSLAWTYLAPAPHAPGTILARWEPDRSEFIFRFDRHWDPMVATLAVPGPPAPRLWAALRPHLLPPAREPSPLWQSRFYCRATLRAAPAGGAGPEPAGEPAGPRFIRVFAHEDHLSLSICSARPAEKISLYGAISLSLPYTALAELDGGADRQRWVLRPAISIGAHEVSQLEIDVPPVEAAEWAVLARLVDAHRGTMGRDPGTGRRVTGVYAIQGFAAGHWLAESADQVRILLREEALELEDAVTGATLVAVPYAAVHACTIARCDPADDVLVVAPRTAVVLRQAGVGVRHLAAHCPEFAPLRQKLESPTAVAVEEFAGVLDRPDGVPTALRLEGGALHADWGLGSARLVVPEITTCRLEREADRLRLRVGPAGREWTAAGPAAALLPLARSLEEAALPGQLERESLAALYRRRQRHRLELLLWGVLGDIAWLDQVLTQLTEESASGSLPALAGSHAAGGCDLLAAHLDNVKAKLALSQLSLPYSIARDDECFLAQLGEVAAPVRARSGRYLERALRAIVRAPLAHLQAALAEIEKNLRARDDLRQVPRPGKLTLGFDASYCATVATALGASVFGPLGAVAGAALSGLKLNHENHSHTELQESLIRDYENNALTWWRHLCDRVLPLLVWELTTECDRLSRSLVPRDRQIYERLARTAPEEAQPRFRAALTALLLAHARLRWGSPGGEAGEAPTAGEILDRLIAAPPPAAGFSGLLPSPPPPAPAVPADSLTAG